MPRNKYEEAYKILSAASTEAFQDIFLLANQVLNKNRFNNRFLQRYMKGESISRQKSSYILMRLMMYYIKSFFHFVLYVFKFMEYAFADNKCRLSRKEGELHIIDSFFLVDNIRKTNAFTDSYFPGLADVLRKKGKTFVYLPFFFSTKRIASLYGILRTLKREKINALTEFQLLSISDIIYILYFIFSYPFHVLKFVKKLHGDTFETALLRHELIDTLDHVTFYNFSRYLQGKRIARLPYSKIKVISWYENDALHKTLYKGLRSGRCNVKIYGAQLFIQCRDMINLKADENEKIFGILPDKIIVSGPFYMTANSSLNYTVGPSLRYGHVFRDLPDSENRKHILVLLSVHKGATEDTMKLLNDKRELLQGVLVKPHPAYDRAQIEKLMPAGLVLTDENIRNLLEKTRIVIGAASGSLVEAICLGIPVVAIKNTAGIDDNVLPEYGKGIIWDEADSVETLLQHISKFEQILLTRPDKIMDVADEYKKMFFCEPTEENIVSTFDL